MRYFLFFIFLFTIFTSGCAGLKETAKGIAGVSTKVLEEGRANAIKKTFNFDYLAAYAKTLGILKNEKVGSYIYAQDIKKHMIAIYVSEQDTTPVGVFFQKVDANNTDVQVSSPSTYAKEMISTRLFAALSGKPIIEEEKKGKTYEEKEVFKHK